MADERHPKVTQRYRELSGEEPSRELDQAILAAAHRSVDKPHAPLVVPAGRHRWYFSLAAAAILVLAVAVTLHVERQQPDAELAQSAPPAPAPQPQNVEPRRETAAAAKAQREVSQDSRQTYSADPPPAAPAPPAARSKQRAASDVAASRPAPAAAPMLQSAARTPEQELERIAELRRLGREDEADKALAEFRERYPDYRISPAMREKVERRPAAVR